MKRFCNALIAFLAAAVFCACSPFIDDTDEPQFSITTPMPTPSSTADSMQAELDKIMKELFPNGIAQVFRDTLENFETDETYSSVWSIYYADMNEKQYWDYMSKLTSESSYRFDIVNSDRISADILLMGTVSSLFPASGVVRTCIDDPDYAYVNAYFFNTQQLNSNGFAYTVKLDIALYNVDENADLIPDNSAEKGSVIGMDSEKAEELYFSNDSNHVIVTEIEESAYGGYTQIDKYSFDDEGIILTKRVRVSFSSETDMLIWFYDNTSDTGDSLYYSPVIVGNTVYAYENLKSSKALNKISSSSELLRILDDSNLDYYESK